MFTLATFQLIRKNCQAEFEALLKKLSIKVDWAEHDRLDAELTEKICGVMKSPTIIDGYMNLLDLGGIAYNYSELDNELLGKVIDNKEKILDAVRLRNAEYDSWQEKWGNASPTPKKVEVVQIKADTAKPFDNPVDESWLKEFWKFVKKRLSSEDRYTNSYRVAYHKFEECNTEAKPLLALDGKNISVDINDVIDLIQKIAEQMRNDEEKILCLKIKKSVSYRPEEIPSEPSKSDFTVDEAEYAFDILRQWNEILSLAR